MIKLWAYRVKQGLNTLNDVPVRYRDEVAKLL